MRFKLALIFILSLLIFVILSNHSGKTLAQDCPAAGPSSTLCIQSGLLSAPTPQPGFYIQPNTADPKVIDPKAAFVPYKIPSYDDLKSIYYTQSKATKISATDTTISSSSIADKTVYNYTSTAGVSIASAFSYTGITSIVFVDKDLSINGNITGANSSDGLVLVVGGNINIAATVTQIDAVLIAQGTIYTAPASAPATCAKSNVTTTYPLTINGSLISLDSTKPIIFCRTLADTTQLLAAEKIIQQPKYLVILRNLMSQTLQKWSEVTQ